MFIFPTRPCVGSWDGLSSHAIRSSRRLSSSSLVMASLDLLAATTTRACGTTCSRAVCPGSLFIGYDAYDDKPDFWITNFAGFFAVGVTFFPTERAVTSPHQKEIGYVHFVFAALLFTTLAIMALRFTKTDPDGHPTIQKSLRNWIYIAWQP